MTRKIVIGSCIVLMALIGVSFSSGQLAQLWKTGQSATYSTGDDGNLQTGAAWPATRFTDNADGTATDNLTGLMWLKDANCFALQSWSNALSKVADFNLHPGTYSCSGYAAGYDDWRLPNRKELLSLIDRSQWNPALPAGHLFVNVQNNSYWSNSGLLASWATTSGGWSTIGVSGAAWTVSLSSGIADKPNMTSSYAVWPVRSVITAGTATLMVSPQSADFGSVDVRVASAPQEFVIENSGPGDLAISSIGTAGSNATMFRVSAGGADPCTGLSPILAENTSCTVLVTFTPASGGAKTASLKIVSNAPATPIYQVPLIGSGVATLSVMKTGTGTGTVTSVPAGISCGTDCTEAYAPNTMVTLTAAADNGSTFTGWTLGGGWSTIGSGSCPGTGSCTVTISAAQAVSANFSLGAFTLTPSVSTGGSITPVSTVTVPAGGSQRFLLGPNPGYHTVDVLVDGVSVGVVSAYLFSNVSANHTIAASFAINTYTITASAGSMGTISPSGPVSVNYGGSQTYTMTPSAGYKVADVLVDGVSKGAVGSYTFSSVSADHTIAASFSPNTYTLTVTKSGSGSGTVTSSPAGIQCGTDCSEAYGQNALVTLSAASDTGSVFMGWTLGGAWSSFSSSSCPGTGPCTVTMNTAQTVVASFNLISAGLTVVSPNGGELVRRGSTYVIGWSYIGNPGATVKIELLKGGVVKKSLTTTAAVGSNGTGTFNWIIAKNQTLGTDYTIRISSAGGFTDSSNGSFTITK